MTISIKFMIGILGCGHIHIKDYVTYLKNAPHFKVSKIWDPNEKIAKKYGEILSAVSVSTADEIINDPSIKKVIICGETKFHKELILKLSKENKSVLIEKPIAHSHKETVAILSKINFESIDFNVAFFLRSNKSLIRLKEIIHAEEIGFISQVQMEFSHSGLLDGWFEDHNWMLKPKEGALGDLSIHCVDLLVWLFGKVEKLTAISHNPKAMDEPNIYGQAMLKFQTGCIASIASGWIQRGKIFAISIKGTKGYVTLEGNELVIHKENSETERLPFHPQATASIENFLNPNISSRTKITKAELIEHSKIMEMIYASSSSSEWLEND